MFFHKEDEKLLKDLLKKVRAQAEAQDPHAATGSRAAEQSALEAIVGSKLTEAEKQGECKRDPWDLGCVGACPNGRAALLGISQG